MSPEAFEQIEESRKSMIKIKKEMIDKSSNVKLKKILKKDLENINKMR